MSPLIYLFLSISYFLSFSSVLAGETSTSSKTVTQITIATSGQADYRYFTLENPPRLVIHFASGNVFADQIPEREEFPEGILASIEAEYYPKKEDQERSPLQGLILTLRSGASYQFIEEENTIVVVLKPAVAADADVGLLTELGLTKVLEGPRELLIDEQRLLIDTFAQAKARQLVLQEQAKQLESAQPIVTEPAEQKIPSQKPAVASWLMAFLWVLLGLILGWSYWGGQRLVMRRSRKEGPSLDAMIAKLATMQEIIATQENQIRTELENRSKIEAQLQEGRKAYELLKRENQEKFIVKENQIQDEMERRQKLEKELQEQREAYLSLEKEKWRELIIAKNKVRNLEEPKPQQEQPRELIKKEIRQFPRVDLTRAQEEGVLVRLQEPSSSQKESEASQEKPFPSWRWILNLSAGGLCLAVPNPETVPEKIRMGLFFSDKRDPIQVVGRKVWEREVVDRRRGKKQILVGICFDSISEEDHNWIGGYVEESRKVLAGV